MSDPKWIDEEKGLEHIPDSDTDFESSVILSTDGKHSVIVKATNQQSRKEALEWGRHVYERILTRYGTKQEQAKKIYNTDELGTCSQCGASNKLSSKGKPYCSALCWKM